MKLEYERTSSIAVPTEPEEMLEAPRSNVSGDSAGVPLVSVLGRIVGFDQHQNALVTYYLGGQTYVSVARRTVNRSQLLLNREVVLLVSELPTKPLITGVVQSDEAGEENELSVVVDGDRLVLSAAKELVLKCGNAHVTLTRAGKILIQGAYVSSRSSGVNRIKGGSVQIN